MPSTKNEIDTMAKVLVRLSELTDELEGLGILGWHSPEGLDFGQARTFIVEAAKADATRKG